MDKFTLIRDRAERELLALGLPPQMARDRAMELATANDASWEEGKHPRGEGGKFGSGGGGGSGGGSKPEGEKKSEAPAEGKTIAKPVDKMTQEEIRAELRDIDAGKSPGGMRRANLRTQLNKDIGTGRHGYNPESVQKAIESSSRHGPKIGGREASAIHRLMKGRG